MASCLVNESDMWTREASQSWRSVKKSAAERDDQLNAPRRRDILRTACWLFCSQRMHDDACTSSLCTHRLEIVTETKSGSVTSMQFLETPPEAIKTSNWNPEPVT